MHQVPWREYEENAHADRGKRLLGVDSCASLIPASPVPRYANSAVHRYAVYPPCCFGETALPRYAFTRLRRYAVTQLLRVGVTSFRSYAVTSLWRLVTTPLCRYAVTTLCRCAVTRFAATAVLRFTVRRYAVTPLPLSSLQSYAAFKLRLYAASSPCRYEASSKFCYSDSPLRRYAACQIDSCFPVPISLWYMLANKLFFLVFNISALPFVTIYLWCLFL